MIRPKRRDPKRCLLVTSALPYANGPLHFGHLLETIQSDIWVRFQKLQGHYCYVKGNCPKCNTPDQYGDSCEHCGATYSPTDLKNPRSALSGAIPEERETEHYFFKLENYASFLQEWCTHHPAFSFEKVWQKDSALIPAL